MGRLLLILALASVAAALAASSAGAGGQAGYGCPPGFNLGALTFDEFIALPRTQAAIEAGLTTPDGARAALAGVDKNGNGVVCGQLQHGAEVSNAPFGQYLYNVVDDNASVPGS
jgi:hypothetical protein